MAKSLKTPTSVWTAVFRRIVQQLENDPTIKRVVGLDNLRSWKGVPGDKNEFVPTSQRARGAAHATAPQRRLVQPGHAER